MKLPDIKAVVTNWKIVLAVVVIYSSTIYFVGRNHGYDSCEAKQSRLIEAARIVTEESNAIAIADKEISQAKIAERKESRDEVIVSVPDVSPSRSRIALNCERLRAAGANLDGFPACRTGAPD
jgi:hypothetical protein